MTSPDLGGFQAHITEETEKAKAELEGWISDLNVKSIGCVDPLTQFGDRNVPGSAALLQREGRLDQFFKARAGGGGQIFVHERCGHLFVNEGLTTEAEHAQRLAELQAEVVRLNAQHNTEFQFIIEEPGSAAPFMK